MYTENRTIDLCGCWQFAWTEIPQGELSSLGGAEVAGLRFFACDVPGNFELDLHKLGKVPEPFFGMNPVEVAGATEKRHVFYARGFDAAPEDGMVPILVFEGLDCLAEVYVNGRLAASVDNMLIRHEIDLSGIITAGRNELFVHIRPALMEAMKYEYPQLVSGLPLQYESLYIRKAPHMYGWDIMPRFVSAGIFRPVFIEYRPEERIEELYLKTNRLAPDHARATETLHYTLRCRMDGDYALLLRMACGGSVLEKERKVQFIAGHIEIEVEHPALWWPKGRGEASLYEVQVSLLKNGDVIDGRTFRHGIRTVELERTALTTTLGEGEFVFKVNGEKVYAKGTNWVPVDAFHSRDRERIPAIMDLVNDLNCNMVRCWGGNVYEDEVFFDICDRSGVLVWQDFAMACGVYPQDDAFAARLAAEAAAVVKRLRNHACVALWSGDNECDSAWSGSYAPTDPNHNRLTRVVLPEAVRVHDGTRPYIGSSPFIDQGAWKIGEEYLPEMHLWGPRDYFKSRFYITALSHFVSEIGYHGCPAPASVEKFISKEKLWPCLGNDEWLLHCTSPVPSAHAYDYRVQLMLSQIAELFSDQPGNLNDFAFMSQVVQAEAKKFFIEMFRIGKWRRTGMLWWNVMDGWPQFSDAVVDYYFAKKLAYHFIRNIQRDVCVMLDEPDSWMQKVVIANDTRRDMVVRCSIQDGDSREVLLDGEYIAFADRSTVVAKIPYVRNRQRFLVIKWEGDAAGQNHYLSGQPPFSASRYKQWLEKSGMYGDALQQFK